VKCSLLTTNEVMMRTNTHRQNKKLNKFMRTDHEILRLILWHINNILTQTIQAILFEEMDG